MIVRSKRGFTLLEVMLGLALLGLGLTVLIKSAANSIFNAEQAHMMGVTTDLARGKMYDIEEKLLKEGFSDTDQSDCDKDFSNEGFPNVHYCAKVDQVEMPDWDTLQQMSQGKGKAGAGSAGSGFGSGSAFGSDTGGGFQNSALGGMLSMFGGGKKDVTSSQGGALIQGQYSMFQQILKVSIRKVTLTVTYKVMGSDRDMKVVAFFTDAGAMDKVINGLGSTELPDDQTNPTNPKTPTPPKPTR